MNLIASAYRLGLRFTGRSAWARAAACHNPMRDLEADLRRRYSGVLAIEPTSLSDACLLFDVREAAEFEVSRLAGAIRVSPRSRAAEVIAAVPCDRLAGATAVFYCAVGVRSARLVNRLQPDLLAVGVAGIASLSGGIFRWHNEGRPLVDAKGRANRVHPYNAHWRQFLLDRTAGGA